MLSHENIIALRRLRERTWRVERKQSSVLEVNTSSHRFEPDKN
jgi:hypothetical protein